MAYGRNRMARNRITTTTSGTTFHHVFIPAANRIIVIVLSIAFAIMMARYNYLVNLAIRANALCKCHRAGAVFSCVPNRHLCFDGRARIYVNNANRILNVSTAVYLLCNITGINGRVR